MGELVFIILASLYVLSESTPSHHIYATQNTHDYQYNCNASHPCNNIIFHAQQSHHINIFCDDINACNNLSITSLSPHRSTNKCNIHCSTHKSCNNIYQLQPYCSCHGHCVHTANRRLLASSEDNNFLSNLPDYVYVTIIGGLALICGILFCIMYCKWRNERIINRNMSARANRTEYVEEEQRSLSAQHEPQLIADNSHTNPLKNSVDIDLNFNQNFIPNKQNNALNIIKQKNTISPESIPLSDPNRATSPFTLNTTPSPAPYNLQQDVSNIVSETSNVISGETQFSSQQSSQPHPAIHIMMQPVPSPNTTPQSNTCTKEISVGHRAIIHKKRRVYNQDSLSMSSVSIPYSHRKESLTATKKVEQNETNTIYIMEKEREIEEIVHRRSKKDHFVLNLPDAPEHEKSNSNLSLSSIPTISVMVQQGSTQSQDSDHECGLKGYEQNILQEEEEPLSPQNQRNNIIDSEHIINNEKTSESASECDININDIPFNKENNIPSNDIIDKQELVDIFKLNEEDTDTGNEIVSDHENEFNKKAEDRKKKKKKKKKEKKKRKKAKRKRKSKKKSKNAIKKDEIEYEPDFVNMEGTHNPPQIHVMGVIPHLQQLADQIAMDKDDDKIANAMDVQSTVSSHPAFDAKNLKHFMEMVDEQNKKMPFMTNDGTLTGGREYKEDDSESVSSGTSNSMDEYSYSTSNADEYMPNDAMSLASADPYPLHNAIDVKVHTNITYIASIKEDEILMTPNGDNDNDHDHTPNGSGNDNNNDKNIHFNQDIYGLLISFMGRHDRWLHCRLVCKSWHQLVYDKCWIFPRCLSMAEADTLKPGDKVDHRDDAGRYIKSTILCRKGTLLHVHYDGWSSKWDSWCDYCVNLHRFAAVRSISRCPRVRGKHICDKMFVDIKPSYRHGTNCNWRKGKVRRLDDYSGQIEVIYKYKQKKYLLWVHLDNKCEVDRVGKHTQCLSNNQNGTVTVNRCSNYSLATTVHE